MFFEKEGLGFEIHKSNTAANDMVFVWFQTIISLTSMVGSIAKVIQADCKLSTI